VQWSWERIVRQLLPLIALVSIFALRNSVTRSAGGEPPALRG
jgi:hypothetical protein